MFALEPESWSVSVFCGGPLQSIFVSASEYCFFFLNGFAGLLCFMLFPFPRSSKLVVAEVGSAGEANPCEKSPGALLKC